MLEIIQSEVFAAWMKKLRDSMARKRIFAKLENLALGNFGDVKPIGEGVSETRIHYGPGYRLYFIRQGEKIVVMLAGGDKSTQENDIKIAKKLAKEWR